LNITCNFLYSNNQVHRDFLITLYMKEIRELNVQERLNIILHVHVPKT